MSLNSSAEREAGGASVGLALPAVPRLAAAAGGYAAWRPLMENVLMRAGVAPRDYKQESADWAALVEAVDRWAMEDESASIAYALGRTTAGSASSVAGPTAAAQKEARRGATEAVARAKRAYALLYQALPDELRRLVAHVPQGHAYGLWSWLERRFQSTEQDNVGDLWDQFTALCQADGETFEEYKARVDHVYGLLTHAKDKPSAGLYAHRLLWKLCATYHPAVLALKASGKLKDADKIDWSEIAAFVHAHERSQLRLDGDASGGHAMAAALTTAGQRRGGRGSVETRECFNCGEGGHLARNCKQPRRARQNDGASEDDGNAATDSSASSGTRRPTATPGQRGQAASGGARASMFLALSSDEEEEEGAAQVRRR
jgi:hypothetical protein